MSHAPRQVLSSGVSSADYPRGRDLTRSLYGALYGIAARLMHWERPDCPLQATILTHDAYLVLSRQRNLTDGSQQQILAAAAKVMRRQLIDNARACRREKRGGKNLKHSLPPEIAVDAKENEAVELRDALENLRGHCETTARIVEMRFFGGMTHAEIAARTGLSERTVGERWRFAKAWLYRALSFDSQESCHEDRHFQSSASRFRGSD